MNFNCRQFNKKHLLRLETNPGWMSNSYTKLKYHSNGCGVEDEENIEQKADDDNNDDEPIAIPTGVSLLNSLFFPIFNGIPRGGVTELVGLPGSGKTTFAMQSCIQALALDPSYAVIYLDSSSNFNIERFSQIYRSQSWAHRIPISDFMARIFPIPFLDAYELLATLYVLPKIISELETLDNFKVVMIVIDNVATPMRLFSTRSIDTRIHLINKLARDLRKLAASFNCAALIINQMTTKKFVIQAAQPDEEREEIAQFRTVPSLGTTWHNHIDTCIALHIQNGSIRTAEILKSVYSFRPLIDGASSMASKKQICLELGEHGLSEAKL